MYGRTQFIGTLTTKAREKVRGFYCLIGTVDKVRADVRWLLTQSRFMYDDIDLEVWIGTYSNPSFNLLLQKKTYDKSKPFSTHLIINIIESVWFTTNARSNLDVETTMRIFAEKDIPLSIILLILSMVIFLCHIYLLV